MSKRPGTAAIGGFVLGALALLILGIFAMGGGKLFSKTAMFVLFFDGSVKGLNIGAPVDFKGVRIGSVTDIDLLFDRRDYSFKIKVMVETSPDAIGEIEAGDGKAILPHPDTRHLVQNLIQKGMRAQLGMQSLVTGQLFVNVDFYPDSPVELAGLEPKYLEIPTIPSKLERITRTVEKVPIDEIAQKLVSAVEGIERFINSNHAQEIVASFNGAAKEAQGLLCNVNARFDPLAQDLEETLVEIRQLMQRLNGQVDPVAKDLRQTVQSTHQLVVETDKRLGVLTTGMGETLKVTRDAVRQAQTTLATIDGAAGDNSALRHDLSNALKEISAAARSLRYLADYLEQHPESLLQGKNKDKVK